MFERLLNLQEIYVSGQNICIEVYGNSVGTITPITLFAVYHSLFAVVNLLRAAVIFSNKHHTITPVNCICRDQVGKTGTKSGIRLRLSRARFLYIGHFNDFSRHYSLVS